MYHATAVLTLAFQMIEAELAQLAVERSALEAAEKEDSGKSKKKGKKSNL